MSSEASLGVNAPRRRNLVAATLILLPCFVGGGWAFQAFYGGMPRGERRAVAALNQLAPVDVTTNDSGSVIALKANSPALTDAAAPYLAKLHFLQRIDLNQSGVGDGAMAAISELPELKSIYLNQTGVTSKGIAALASCGTIEELTLSQCPIDDEALVAIAKMKHLKLLDLSKTAITNTGMSHLETLTRLHTLYLRETSVTGDGFAMLRNSSELRLVDLGDSQIDQATIEALRFFPRLDRLHLGHTMLTDTMLPEFLEILIDSCPELRGLAIQQTPLSDVAVEPLKRLAELPNLAVVDLRDTKITKSAYLQLTQAVPEVNFTASYSIED
ncbi:Leucine Rich repeats (2 copies) [Rosistilla ulvae]|uniref:Leucine Rich repeats (2 copies) n=1 Tax=Rosistilla ulvae TaxID=1930277 RepID=A0A517M7V3_9BACT|nr:hypothetical protein [Rosistilla ulvae]QDS90867.1 Leucine Rich repeats (2 copies) [Rosistilla ulvae]